MIRGAIGVLAMVLLSACGPRGVRTDAPPPADAHCDAMCFVPCVAENGDTGVRWDGTPTDPAMFDALATEVTLPLADKLRTCELRRRACVQCLQRLQREDVIQ